MCAVQSHCLIVNDADLCISLFLRIYGKSYLGTAVSETLGNIIAYDLITFIIIISETDIYIAIRKVIGIRSICIMNVIGSDQRYVKFFGKLVNIGIYSFLFRYTVILYLQIVILFPEQRLIPQRRSP